MRKLAEKRWRRNTSEETAKSQSYKETHEKKGIITDYL
jgi:hypothetical protein